MPLFTLEAVFAKHGDALILHYGDVEDPKRILIDGGPPGVYNQSLRPRLAMLQQAWAPEDEPNAPLSFELAMVSHVDSDHIAGVVDLFEEVDEATASHRPPLVDVKRLWHNAFDDIIDPADLTQDWKGIAKRLSTAALGDSAGVTFKNPDMRAVVASTKQGRELRDLADKLAVTVNDVGVGKQKLIARSKKKSDNTHEYGDDVTLTVLGPSAEEVASFQEKWNKDLKKAKKDGDDSIVEVAQYLDASEANLASIVVLVEWAGGDSQDTGEKLQERSILLTGDARGDHIIDALEAVGKLTPGGDDFFEVDVLKMPHHGSNRNIDKDFFARIRADHYVISADGLHDNPDVETLDMLHEACAAQKRNYTLHVTVGDTVETTPTTSSAQEHLGPIIDWLAVKRKHLTVSRLAHQKTADGDDVYRILLDLGDLLEAPAEPG